MAADVTPDRQKARYESRKRPEKSIADHIDDAYAEGEAAGRKQATQASSTSSSRGPLSLKSPGALPSIAVPMLVELILVSADDLLTNHHPPLPSRLLSVFAIFGILGLARGNAAKPATAFAWALVVASLYAQTSPNGTSGAIGALTQVGNFVSGKYGKTTPSTTKGGS